MAEQIITAAELDALHMAVSIAAHAALVMDAGHRDWLVWEDDGGDLWATSYHTEDDETDIRARILVDAERLRFPLTVLYCPDQPQRAQPKSIEDVAAERATHEGRGWTAEHDAEHGAGHLISLAHERAADAARWDFIRQPAYARSQLVKAASLLVAAIDLLDNLEEG